MYKYMCICALHVCAHVSAHACRASGGQKRALDFQELELLVSEHLMWVLETILRSSVRAVSIVITIESSFQSLCCIFEKLNCKCFQLLFVVPFFFFF